MKKILSGINYLLLFTFCILFAILKISFYIYSKQVYINLQLKSYFDFLGLIVMPAIILLPFFAGIVSNIKAMKDKEFKNAIITLFSNVLFIIACILSINVLSDTAHSVIGYEANGFLDFFFYRFVFLFYPIQNDSLRAIFILGLVFAGGVLPSLSNVPALICSFGSVAFNIFVFIIFYSYSKSPSESGQALPLNIIIYGNLILSVLSVIFAFIDD